MATVLANIGFRVLPAMAALVLGACASLPKEQPDPPPEVPEQFSVSGDEAAPDRWWRAFEDPQLNALVTRALDENLTLQASYQRLLQARAAADRQGAALFPSLDASAGAERQESDTAETTRFNAGLSASYEVDLWGRIRSLTEAQQQRAVASLADYQAAAITLSGEITTTWFQLLEQRSQLQLAEQQLDINRKLLTLIETRFGVGQSGSADVLRQRQLVAASLERLGEIAAESRVLEHQLAVLLGQPPGGARIPPETGLPALPPLPQTGVPAALIQRRPDIEQAWRLVLAADQEVAAAIANRFPRFSIEASVRSQSTDASELFNDWLTTLAGNLVMPLVDGGQRRAEVRRTRAVLEERLRQYGQEVITAIQEVEDALARELQRRQRLESLQTRIRLSEAAYRQLRTRYLNGAVSYLEVLNALQEQQDLQRTLLTSRQQLLAARVALYRALAGGLELPGDTTPRDANATENDPA